MLKTIFLVVITVNLYHLVYTEDACGENEILVDCPDTLCEPKTCSELGFPIACPGVTVDGSCPGQPGCLCKSGYLRNDDGVCIPSKDCPSCGGDSNAKPGCGINCGRLCSNYDKGPVGCPKICKFNACDCKNDFVYDETLKKCVLPEDCAKCTGPNEVYDEHPTICPPQTCDSVGKSYSCLASVEPLEGACVCRKGYLRNNDGVCIAEEDCSCGGDPNAVPGCGVNCGRLCSNYNKGPVACPEICKLNGCDCRKGYVYDDNLQKCVLPKQCSPVCGVHEVFSNCTNGGCSPRNCSQWGKPIPCIKLDPSACKKGCVCENGYLRADNGTCIPDDQCPRCLGQNEVYNTCPLVCPPQTCEAIGKTYYCPFVPANRTAIEGFCKPACRCQSGYYRNLIDQCISKEDCLKCTGPHEYFTCGGACDNVCATIKTQNQTHCPIINKTCNKKCYCEKGYARNANNVCIPIDHCEGPVCGINEVYSNCSNGLCKFEYCYQYGDPVMYCPKFNTSNCIGGCVCKNKYLRNSDGVCIPQAQCPATLPTTVAPREDDEDIQNRLIQGNIIFTVNFLYEVIKNNPLTSVVMSPFSVLIPLAELALYTQSGNSYNQLLKTLNLHSKDEIRRIFPRLINSLKSQQEAILDLAAKIYVNKNYQLTDNFEKDSCDIFGAEAENIDFSNTQQAADTINDWAEKETRELIKNLVSPNMFSASTRLVLTNFIYFLGNWENQFNLNDTKNDDFHISNNKTVQVPMMVRKGVFKYAESEALNCKILEITYKGANFSYVAFLPNDKEGYNAVAEKLRDPDVFNTALDSLQYNTCYIYIPRHEITTSIDLVDVLQTINVTDIFDTSKANLSGILTNNDEVGVSAAIQKANIKLDETGTEAAAANAIGMGITSVSQPQTVYTFKVDHPTIFFLLFERNPLFCGVYAGNE
ncbi:zonadhesin-like isoform X2 [Galleria mellonella]|uniref:Zonadhesin-like isoform X2 n=1 Tax=Galleria mellonella TaxID=7137 RepID=A0ABM3MHQ1_GALME|nr:zonadhesin-like isoform X2 [Galleria mellonella]